MSSEGRRPLPWLALLIPLGWIPSYVTGPRPGLAASLAILLATAVAWIAAARMERRERLPAAAGWAITLALGLLFAAVTGAASSAHVAALGRKEAFATGIFQQALWWTARGVPMGVTYSTTDAGLHSQFGIHFSPLLMFLTPFYRLRPLASTLLFAQALALALAALPLYGLARRPLGRTGAVLIAAAWLLNPTVAGAPLAGFHDLAFLPLAAFGALWALEAQRYRAYLAALLAMLLLREDLAFFVTLLALVALFRGAPSRYVWTALIGGLGWAYVTLAIVMPRYRLPTLTAAPDVFFRQYLGSWGATPAQAARSMLAHPAAVLSRLLSRESAQYLLAMLRPVGLVLPLPDPAWLAGAYNLGLGMVSDGGALRSPLTRYALPVVTAFFMALPKALTRWGGRTAAAAAIVLVSAVLSLGLLRVDRQYPARPRGDLALQKAALAVVPGPAAVLAPDWAYAALANRERYACVGTLGARALEPAVLGKFDAVVVDLAAESFERDRFPVLLPDLLSALQQDVRFAPVYDSGGIHAFVRKDRLSPSSAPSENR